MTCCICKKEFHGFSNNPHGALNENYEPIKWKPTAVCCDACNKKYVIPGRLYILKKEKEKE